MISPISSLANMEMMLYGGLGTNTNAPSYFNGYMANLNNNSFCYPSFYGNPNNYNNMNSMYYNNPNSSVFGQNVTSNYTQPNIAQQQANVAFDQKAMSTLADFYANNELSPSESLKSAIFAGGIGCAVMQNPRLIFHPWNYFKTSLSKNSDTKNIFKNVKGDGSKLNKLWKENSLVMEAAYSQMHRAEARKNSKLGLFRKRYTPEEYNKLKDIMETAIKNEKIDEIAEATETLRHAYCRNGKVFQAWNWMKNGFKNGKEGLANPIEMINNQKGEDTIAANTKRLLDFGGKKITIPKAFKKAGGIMALLFGALEIFMNIGKIQTAKNKDAENAQMGINTNYGKQQTKQTVVKAVGNTLGWAAGETLSIWAYSKLGAAIGTAFGPGVGTAVGAAIGFVGGSIGMWLAGKATRASLGIDVADKITAQNKTQTEEGQTELLESVINKINSGEKVSPEVEHALGSIIAQYQASTPQSQLGYYA